MEQVKFNSLKKFFKINFGSLYKLVKLVLQIGHEAHLKKNGPTDWCVFVRSLKNRTPLKSVINKVVFSYEQLGERKESIHHKKTYF